MDRETARQEIRSSWKILFPRDRSGKGIICPLCKSGSGPKGTGITANPKKPGQLTCWACGFSGDAIDLIQKRDGADYNKALQTAAAELGITIDPADRTDGRTYPTPAGLKTPPQNAAEGAESGRSASDDKNPTEGTETPTAADYREYYKACRKRLNDPAAVSYLQARGISIETAAACFVGYDPQADPAGAPGEMGDGYRPHPAPRIIFPTSPGHYTGRSIDPNTPKAFAKMNPSREKGAGSPGIFNNWTLKERETVFITEGAFDALSFVEAGAAAVALNSKGNGQALLDLLKKQAAEVKARQFIICPDNDEKQETKEATQRQAQELCDNLRAAGYTCIVYNVAGDYHDANDALVANRAGFEQRIKEALRALEKATLPGLLVYDDVVRDFQEADDEIIEIKSFPQFSKAAKIKRHSTVVIAADTGGGKSSLAINFMNSLNGGHPCIYFNLEMDRLTVMRRLVAIQSGLELDRIEGYRNDPGTAAAVNLYLKAITGRQPLQIIQDVYLLEQIEGIIKASTEGRQAPTMVFIDHSLLIELSDRVTGRYDRFTIISERLRKVALKYNIVLFVLLQQNRAGKADDAERPKNSSLKESGSWENDATHICFLWWDPTAKRKKLLLTKNRGGEQGEFLLNYSARTQTYTEATEQPAATTAGRGSAQRITKRDKARERLQDAYTSAVIATDGKPTLRAIAEAADVTTRTVSGWIKEYGGCTVDGAVIDPAGIDTEVEYTGFIRLTPAESVPLDEAGDGENKLIRL